MSPSSFTCMYLLHIISNLLTILNFELLTAGQIQFGQVVFCGLAIKKGKKIIFSDSHLIEKFILFYLFNEIYKLQKGHLNPNDYLIFIIFNLLQIH